MSDGVSRAPDASRRFGNFRIEDMDSAQRQVNDWLVSHLHPEQLGRGATMGGPMDVLLHNANLAELTGRMATLIFEGLSVPRRATEVAILITARHWNCNYSFETHRRYGLRYGVEPEVIDSIEAGVRPQLEGELVSVYRFTTELLRNGDVTDHAFREVADLWGNRGAAELIATVGFSSMIALALNVDRYPGSATASGGPLPVVGDGSVGASFFE